MSTKLSEVVPDSIVVLSLVPATRAARAVRSLPLRWVLYAYRWGVEVENALVSSDSRRVRLCEARRLSVRRLYLPRRSRRLTRRGSGAVRAMLPAVRREPSWCSPGDWGA